MPRVYWEEARVRCYRAKDVRLRECPGVAGVRAGEMRKRVDRIGEA